jgi:hypothetical protein
VSITLPLPTDILLGPSVAAIAGSKRGVTKVEVLFNGFKWAEVRGAPFGTNGQLDPSTYSIPIPANLPNSVVDVQIRACDDLDRCTDSAVRRVTKGAPCATADTCAKGQRCDAEGRCIWDPPVGQLGDECSYPQFCVSGLCRGTAETQICTQDCLPTIEDSCPSGYACVPVENGQGICFFPDDGGCCSASPNGGRGVPWAPIAFAALTLGLIVRPWRRR